VGSGRRRGLRRAARPRGGAARRALVGAVTETAFARAQALHRRGDVDAAEPLYRAVLEAMPDHPGALHFLGMILSSRGDNEAALLLTARSVALAPEDPTYRLNHGVVLAAAGRDDAALIEIEAACRLMPREVRAWRARARVLQRNGRWAEAAEAWSQVTALLPEDAPSWVKRGDAHAQADDPVAALAAYDAAIARDAAHALAWCNRGFALQQLDRTAEAEASLRRALAIEPDLAEAHYNLGMLMGTMGRFSEAWSHYEARWQLAEFRSPRRSFPQPQWQGEDLRGRSLLIWGEQGVGDEVLSASMLDDAARRAGRLIVECDKRLVPLFARSWPGIAFEARSEPPSHRGDTDVQIAAGSLGAWLRPDEASFRRPSPGYLQADAERAARLRARYRALGAGPLVGISWRSKAPSGTYKSMTLPMLADALPGATLVSLQYGKPAGEIAALARDQGIAVHLDPEIDATWDLDALAAQIAALDLIVTVSNTTAHVAGALGMPVWTLLPRGPGLLWYWLRGRTDSPWYPSMRLFRQDTQGDWASVLRQVGEAFAGGYLVR